MKRSPIKRRPRRERTIKVADGERVSIEDKGYLRWLTTQQCWCCSLLPSRQAQCQSAEPAHVGRGSMAKKCPDRQSVPLGAWHHRIGPHAEHVLTGNGGKDFWDYWGADRDEVVKEYNEAYENQRAHSRG